MVLPEITLSPRQWELYTRLGVDHQRQHCRVAAAKWYWSRKMGVRHYIIETRELPVIIEVRRRPGGNFAGRDGTFRLRLWRGHLLQRGV